MCPGGAEQFCAEYQAVYDAMTNPPDADIAIQQDIMVRALVAGGVWTKLDIFYLFAQQSNADGEALINWINPGTFDATLVNAPAFASLEGFTGDGASAYINANWNPTSHGVNYTLNDCAAGYYTRTNNNHNSTCFGMRDDTIGARTYIELKAAGDLAYGYVNTGGSFSSTITDTSGLYIVRKYDAANASISRNGVTDTKVEASVGVPDVNLYFLATNDDDSNTRDETDRQISMGFAGKLTVADVTVFTNAIEAYMDSNGKGVIP